MDINIIFQIAILVISVIIHEISHGAMALAFGDKTAQYEGRLTLNPLKHIDWFGSVLLPFFLVISGVGFIIGWAKPVPYNPYNLRNRNVAEPLVALAGPLSNILIALIFGVLIRILVANSISGTFITSLVFVVIINIALAVFNLIPIPPLDGSKILFSLLPVGRKFIFSDIASRYGFFILVGILLFLPNFISPIIFKLFTLITGLSL
ncbi:MAG: site-2 protease family protein [bacterium]